MKRGDISRNPYVTERDWIGQGWGYKVKDFESAELDDVVYIPEYGYDTTEREGVLVITSPFTKQDFIDLCAEDDCPVSAEVLFDMVDWQFPETLLDELWNEEEK